MKKRVLFVTAAMAVFAIFASVNLVGACGLPNCPHHPDEDVNIAIGGDANASANPTANAIANPVVTANPVAYGGRGGEGGKGGSASVDITNTNMNTAMGGQGGIGTGGSVGNVTGGSVGNITIEGTNIQVPRNFSELPPEIRQQFSFAFGALYLRSHLEKEEKKFLNDLLGPVPNSKQTLSRETISKNATSKYDIGIKQILNELPIFEFLVKGDKGISNFKARLEFNEDRIPAGPANTFQFVQKLNTTYFQIVDRSDLESAGWQIGTVCIIQGVPGVWLSGLKWAGYRLLMERTGYLYGTVLAVYRSNVQEAAGKNMQVGGAGSFLTGGVDQNAYNLLLNMGKGSGQNWESQKFDIVLAGLKRIQPDAPLLIGAPKPPSEITTAPEPKKEVIPPPPEKCEAEKKKIGELEKELEGHKEMIREAGDKLAKAEKEKIVVPPPCPVSVEFDFDRWTVRPDQRSNLDIMADYAPNTQRMWQSSVAISQSLALPTNGWQNILTTQIKITSIRGSGSSGPAWSTLKSATALKKEVRPKNK